MSTGYFKYEKKKVDDFFRLLTGMPEALKKSAQEYSNAKKELLDTWAGGSKNTFIANHPMDINADLIGLSKSIEKNIGTVQEAVNTAMKNAKAAADKIK